MSATSNEVNASGDFIRNLKLGQTQSPVVKQGASDRMAEFFLLLKGSEGTVRNWAPQDQAAKLTYLNAYTPPEREKGISEEEFRDRQKAWVATMMGVIYMEVFSSKPDRLVAQAAFDYLFPGKIGKR
jgi:hypothetical protein